VPTYSGITSDLQRRKSEHEKDRSQLRNWRVVNNGLPFPSQEAAQKWEQQVGEHHPGGAPASGP
jgi:predicted GIY-YIG superfamily endonuclease